MHPNPCFQKTPHVVNQLDGLTGHSTTRATTACPSIYARVSSSKQRSDFHRQLLELQEAYPDRRVITDIARPGDHALLDAVHRGGVSQITFMRRDRLARFASTLLECVFRQQRIKLVVHCQGQENQQHRLGVAEEVVGIATAFVASHPGKRAAEGRRRRKRQKEEAAQACQVQGEKNVQSPQDPKDHLG